MVRRHGRVRFRAHRTYQKGVRRGDSGVRVLVIPEDSRRDKGLLKPLIEALMAAAGRPRAKVRVCEKPVLGGVAEALKLERLREIIDLWGGQTDLFLLIVDRD